MLFLARYEIYLELKDHRKIGVNVGVRSRVNLCVYGLNIGNTRSWKIKETENTSGRDSRENSFR